jgi:hypothetical protein
MTATRHAKAFTELRRHLDAGTIDTHAGRLAIFRACLYGSPDFNSTLEKYGLLPPATGYAEDGTPILSLPETARKLGISEEEAIAVWAKEWAGHPIHAADSPVIHRKQ